jgi:outer membrane protein assembly factor BamB
MAADPAAKPRWWKDRRKLAAALAGAALVIGGGIVLAYELLKRPEDVSNPDVPFVQEKPPKPVVKTTNWPMFGYDRARTRWLRANRVKPPFKRIWKYGDKPLLEFPPIFVGGRLYFVNNNGFAYSLDADTGKILWERRIATKNASSPAYARGRLFIVNLEPGQVLALDPKTGKTIWKRSLPGRSESSPLVIGRKVIFGCENGQLFALNTRNGKTKWTAELNGAVKAAPAYRNGILFVGDYGGTMSAVRARNGEIKWQSDALGPGFGRAGPFYATPAIGYGRVFSGNNDSRVYSFDQDTGELAWTYSTGSYVYSGTAIADTQAAPPTVYVGSIDGNIYALDAKSGEPRWTHSAGGPVIGSLSIIGNIVYVATFEGTTTRGFKLASGRKVFSFHTGAYMPVISDGRRLYLTGYSSISALVPVRKGKPKDGAKQGKRGSRGGQGDPEA